MSNKEKQLIKNTFKGYRKMNRAMRSLLESYDLVITSEGKHHKIKRADSKGGFCTLSKSSSDRRSGVNFSSNLIKLIEAE